MRGCHTHQLRGGASIRNKKSPDWGILLTAAAGRITNDFGNRNILVQQEIIFAVTGFIRTCAGRQCHNGKQRQHYFFHVLLLCFQKYHGIISPCQRIFNIFIGNFSPNESADRIRQSHPSGHHPSNDCGPNMIPPPPADAVTGVRLSRPMRS